MPNQFSEITRHTEQNLEKVIEYVKNKPTSLANACKELNISYPCAYRLIKQSEHRNLISRSRNGKKEIYNNVSRKRSKINDSNVEKVKTLYFEEMLTLKDLSEVFETSAATVLHFFRKHNLKTRTKSEANFLKYEKNTSLRDHCRNLVFEGKTGYPNNEKRESWIEKLMREWLENNKINFIQEYRINGYGHSYDFKVGNVLIEMDGVYWHSTTKQKNKDSEFEKIAVDNGFKLYRITDIQLKKYGILFINENIKPLLFGE